MTMIETEALAKTYRNGIEALRGVSFRAHEGQICCMLGPNGAGKTTTLRIVATQLLPTSGRATVLGHDVVREASQIRRQLAVVPQEASPDAKLRTWEHVAYYLRARGLSRKEAMDRTEQALGTTDLLRERDQVIGTLSGGQRRRVLIAMAIATGAAVLLLDEPTAGLDPLARRAVWAALLQLKQRRCVILTTHSMDEAEALADRVVILNGGRIIADDTVTHLRTSIPTRHRVYVSHSMSRELLLPFGRVESHSDRWVLYPRDVPAAEEVVTLGMSHNCEVSVQPTSLEDVYIRLLEEHP